MKRRFILWLAFILALSSMAPQAKADTTSPKPQCYFSYSQVLGDPIFFNCTDAEVRLLGVKMLLRTWAQIYEQTSDQATEEDRQEALGKFYDWAFLGADLQASEPGMTVRLWSQLSSYQAIDAVRLGSNVTFATVPATSGSGYVLIVQDKLGRQMKVAGKNVTGGIIGPACPLMHTFDKYAPAVGVGMFLDITSAALVSKTVPALTPYVSQAARYVPSVAAAGTWIADKVITPYFDSVPDCGTTDILYDLLHTGSYRGEEFAQVYRVSMYVTPDGHIHVRGKGFWFLGNADKYEGKWVW